MSQGNSRRDGVCSSAPVSHLPGTVSSNQGQHTKLEISDTSQSSAKHGFKQYDMYVLQLIARYQNLRYENTMTIPLIGHNGVARFGRQSIVVPYQATKNDLFKNAVNGPAKKRWLVWVIWALCMTRLGKHLSANSVSRT